MKTPFSDVLKRFLALSDLVETESAEVHAQIVGSNLGVAAGSAESAALMKEPFPCSDALQAFLMALPDAYVQALVALMYSGRDRDADAVALWESVKATFADKDFAVESIVEKSPRAEYIKQGMEYLAKKMPLNDLPAAIAAV